MAKTEKRESLKVLTYNLWHGLNPKGLIKFEEYETPEVREERLQNFLKQARELNPDIIFLQEVNPVRARSKQIAKELNMDSVYKVGNAGLKIGAVGFPINLHSGLAILAKKDLRLKKLGGKKLSGTFGECRRWGSWQLDEFRYALLARVFVNGQQILLMDCHLHHGLEVTKEYAEEIDKVVEAGKATKQEADEVKRIGNGASERRRGELEKAIAFAKKHGFDAKPMLFAGDFNASPDAPEIMWLKDDLSFSSITKDDEPEKLFYTWDPKFNKNTLEAADFVPANEFERFIKEHFEDKVVMERRRLDYVFYRNLGDGFSIKDAGIFGNEPQKGKMASDHFGVWGEFELEKSNSK